MTAIPLVRPATPADAEAIAALTAANDDQRATPAHIADHIAYRAHFETPYVAELDGTVVGLACLRLLPALCDPTPYAELTELVVAPAHRRLGVGRALVRHIEAVARDQGAAELVLLTAWRNTHAHAFYHALGYTLYTLTMRRSLREAALPAEADSIIQ